MGVTRWWVVQKRFNANSHYDITKGEKSKHLDFPDTENGQMDFI